MSMAGGLDAFDVEERFQKATFQTDQESLTLARERSQIVFDDLTRSHARAHGQSYVDKRLVVGQNATVTKGNLPNLAQVGDYTPANTAGSDGVLRLKPIGGGGFDCRSAKIYTQEGDEQRPTWHRELCTEIRDGFNGWEAPIVTYGLNPNNPLKNPDGIPDALWVDPDVENGADGTALDPDYLRKHRSIVVHWTDGQGAPDGKEDRHPYSHADYTDLRDSPLAYFDRSLGEFGIVGELFGIVFNREFIINKVQENGVTVKIEHINPQLDCKRPKDLPDAKDPDGGGGGGSGGGGGGNPGGPGDNTKRTKDVIEPNTRYPFGHPDDYQAPWTFEAPASIPSGDLDSQYLHSIIANQALDPWSSAWSQAVVNALEPRIRQAQAMNLSAASAYYQFMLASINYDQDHAIRAKIMNSAQLSQQYNAAAEQASTLMSAFQDELSSQTRAGQPATYQEIYDYWMAQIEADPILAAWNALPEAQAWTASAKPFLDARQAYFTAQNSSSDQSSFQRKVFQERTKVDRAMQGLVGVGVLKGGLETWTIATMTFSGLTAQVIDPLTVSPQNVPPVLIVPTGAFERYQQFDWSRTWLETYTASGGTLVVLAQAFGRDWELLPGGEVRGLGFEEDILCREASVDIINPRQYLAGIRKDTPDLQLDGSFTQYPADATVILKRRTGNLMPAMIEYPYGLGKVVATSLYSDFAVINGMQSGDDLPFARSFFLHWWAEATGAVVTDRVPINQPFSMQVDLVNTSNTPLTNVEISTDAVLDGPDTWRYKVHYRQGGDSPEAAAQTVDVNLDPPLAPGEQRLVDVDMPAVAAAGYHRLGINGTPAELYMVESPTVYEITLNMHVARDQSSYWLNEPIRLTIHLTPTEALDSAKWMTVNEQNGFFSRSVYMQPGTPRTLTVDLVAEQKHLQTPFNIYVRDSGTNQFQTKYRFNVPAGAPPVLNVEFPANATNSIPLSVTNVGVHGTSFSGTLRLTDQNGYFLLSQDIAGEVGHTQRRTSIPITQHFTVELPGNQAAGVYSLSYNLRDEGGKIWRGAQRVDLPGLSAEVETETELPVYDPTQTITTSTSFTPNMSLDDSWLNLTVKKPFADISYRLLAGGLSATDGQGRDAHFYDPSGIAMSNDGSYALIADTVNGLLRHVNMNTGEVRTLAGNMEDSYVAHHSDAIGFADGIGQHVYFWQLETIALSPDETYALIIDGNVIRKFEFATRRVTTIAGDPTLHYWGDSVYFMDSGLVDGFGTDVRFYYPDDIKISHDGTFAIIADGYAIRRLDLATYEVTTLAGQGYQQNAAYTYEDGIGSAAEFGSTLYVALAPDDQTAYIVDYSIHTIRKLDLQTQDVTTIVGATQTSGYVNAIGGAARLRYPTSIDIDSTGTYAYFVDGTRLRRFDLQTLEVSTVSGDATTTNPCSSANYPGINGHICGISSISLFSDDSRLGLITGQVISTFDFDSLDLQPIAGERWTGSNGLDRFTEIGGVAWMPSERSALMLGNNVLWQVDTQGGQQTLLAGGHYTTSACQNTDGIGETARFCKPEGLALSPDTSFALIADTGNKVIRRYDLLTQEVTTVAGSGTCTSSTIVDGIGTAAQLCNVSEIQISADASYALFIDNGTYPRYIDALRRLDLQTYEVTTIIDDDGVPDFGFTHGLELSPQDDYALMPMYDRFLKLDLQTLETTVLTGEGSLEDFYYEEYGYYYPLMDPIENPSDIEISADGTFAIFADTHGLKRWDFISNTIHLLSKNVDTGYNQQLAMTQDGSRLLFASHYSNSGDYGSALQEAELAATLYDQWFPLSGTGVQTLTNPLIDPALATDSRARGTLVLQAAIYGPQRTDALTTERQLIARDASFFVITPDSYTMTVVPEPSEVRLGDSAALQGVVRNITAQTGVTIAVSANGVALPDVVLLDVAPGEVARFSVPVDTSSPGFYNYTLATPDGTSASAEVGVFGPGIMVDPLLGDTQVNVNTTAVFTTTIENQSPLDGSVTVEFADQAPITFDLAGNTAISATFTLPITETTPRFLTIPVTFSGDLEEQRSLELEVLFTGQAEFEVASVIAGVPVTGQVITASLEPTLAPLAIPNDGERSVKAPIMITQTGAIHDINVQISLVHSNTSDLQLTLVAPNGQEVLLHSTYATYGQNLLETTFDDQAAGQLYTGSSPYTGSFQPSGSLDTLEGASLAGAWYLKIKDTSADSFAGRLLDWKMIVTPQAVDTSTAVVAGQPVQILTTLQPIKRGLGTLNMEGLEGIAQQPLLVTAFDPVVVSTMITVPSTLPGGEYPFFIAVGATQVEIPVQIRNWEVELSMHMPVSSIQAGEIFTPEVTITETAGLSGEPVVYVRYGTTVVTQELLLEPNSVQTVPVSLTASNDARRVSISIGNPPTEDDPPFVAIIDSRPINVHRFGAHVILDQAQVTSGTTLTGQLVIDGDVTQVSLSEPSSLGGDLLWTASEISATVEWEGRDRWIDLATTPTGTWDFAISIPEDLPAGRYALPFMVDGIPQPVLLDVQGPHLTIHQTNLSGSSEALSITMQVESTTAISLTPYIFYRENRLEVQNVEWVEFIPGKQEVVLSTSIPEWLRGVGPIDVVFVSAYGNPLGGTQIQYQSQPVAILSADLLGESLTETITLPTTLLVSGPATFTLSTADTTLLTENLDTAGYVDLNPTILLPAETKVVTLTLTDVATGVQDEWVIDITLFISPEDEELDTLPPTISLNPPTGSLNATWTTPVTFTGVVSDNVAISSVSIRGQLAQINAETGVFTAVVLLEPGTTTLSALAEDSSGNTATSNEVAVEVGFVPPSLSTLAPLSVVEGDVVTLTFTLNTPSALSGTLRVISSGGTATAGEDYEPIDQVLTFVPLQTTQSITFTIPDDGIQEEPETLILTLTDPLNVSLDQSSFTIDIQDRISSATYQLFLPLVRRTP